MTDDQDNRAPELAALKTRPFDRNVALTRLGVSAGTRIALHEFANLFRGRNAQDVSDREFYRAQAVQLAAELGRLKGSVMKVGQMLSLYGQYFLPSEAVEVLAGLQDNTAPVPWRSIAPVLQRALGDERLAELDIVMQPLASASLGQVHRATRRSDGGALVLKVQYPGVADAIESDVRTLSRIVSMTRIAPRGLDLAPVFKEVSEMLHREVDYAAEREHTEVYARQLAADPRYVVPTISGRYCSDQVLALSFESSVHVRDPAVQALPQGFRDHLAQAALELFLLEFFDWGRVQTDPHFGNYRIRLHRDAEPQLVLLDFGATRLFGRGFINGYRLLVQGALAGDAPAIHRGAEAIGLMSEDFPDAVRTAFAELCELIVEPFRGGAYDWGASDLPQRVADKVARNALTRWFRLPPREIVFLHRRLAGVFILLATLGARIDGRQALVHTLEQTTGA